MSRQSKPRAALLLLVVASVLLSAPWSARADYDDGDSFDDMPTPSQRRSGGSGGGVQGRGNTFDGVLEGRVLIPDQLRATRAVGAPDIGINLYTSQGTVLRVFCAADGMFTFHDVPVGSHLLHVDLMGVGFPEVRLDVTSRDGLVRARMNEGLYQPISVQPLFIRPLGIFSYYEKRKPLDIRGLIMSPYGLMIGFSLIAIFVFPRMKVDPEEYKELQQSLGGGSGAARAGAAAAPARVRSD